MYSGQERNNLKSGITQIKLVNLNEKIIQGISTRTTNANEMNRATAKIGALYQLFDKKVIVDYKNGSRVYGVYFNYDSDLNGEYSVLAGTDQVDQNQTLESMTLPGGKYLVFEAKGVVPQVVIDTWGVIWHYFANENSQFKRAYTVDFEYYKTHDEIEIYIAVK